MTILAVVFLKEMAVYKMQHLVSAMVLAVLGEQICTTKMLPCKGIGSHDHDHMEHDTNSKRITWLCLNYDHDHVSDW